MGHSRKHPEHTGKSRQALGGEGPGGARSGVRAAGQMQGVHVQRCREAMTETVLVPLMCWRGRSGEGDARVDGELEPWVLCQGVLT